MARPAHPRRFAHGKVWQLHRTAFSVWWESSLSTFKHERSVGSCARQLERAKDFKMFFPTTKKSHDEHQISHADL